MERDAIDYMDFPETEDFNSRAHVERDMSNYTIANVDCQISTHALTWSATT